MAVIRHISNSDSISTYLATVALFCGISCTILMLRFKSFKVTFNISGKRSGKEQYDLAPQVSVNGAYRTCREEYFGSNNYSDTNKKNTPSMVKLPQSTNHVYKPRIINTKSVEDSTKINNVPADVRKSTSSVAVKTNQNSKDAKRELKEQKKLEKRKPVERKKTVKFATEERDKEEKEKQAAQKQAKGIEEKDNEQKRKNVAPQAQQTNRTPQSQQMIVAQQSQQRNSVRKTQRKTDAPLPPQNLKPKSQKSSQYSTNTLESSISRSSGPPPYSDGFEIMPNKSDKTGNTSFGKQVEEASSWDMVSQHRQQMNRTKAKIGTKTKETRLNLASLTVRIQ